MPQSGEERASRTEAVRSAVAEPRDELICRGGSRTAHPFSPFQYPLSAFFVHFAVLFGEVSSCRRAAKKGRCQTGTAGQCETVVMEIHRRAPTMVGCAAA
jgi:hypothetical protein